MAQSMQDTARKRGGFDGPNQNRAFHKRTTKGGGEPKDTTDGKDTSQNATNVIGGTELTQKPVSPSARSQNGG